MNTVPRKLGRYDIIREVGRGAMGVVYKAHDPVIDREVALKAIELSFQVTDDEKEVYLTRFYREAKAAGKLSHPGIVTIYDAGEDKETRIPFIVMEFLEGTTLQEVTSSGILLPIGDVNNIMMQLADALHYAHNQEVVHRDIKSANILIVEGMKAKITDFGIARLPSSDLTRTGQFVGTPNYMSPEQVEGKSQVDGRSDLFSLGVIFYMLLTGERPFGGDNFSTVSYKIVHVDPIPPRVINPAVPEIYNRILSKLLRKDPDQRYQSGAELMEDLKRASGGGALESIPADEMIVTTPAVEPAKQADSEKRIQGAEKASPSSPEQREALLYATVILFAAVALVAGVSSHRPVQAPPAPVKQVEIPPLSKQEDPLLAMSRQNTIRIKWDLAVNYYQNGLYDKSIEQLNALLAIDPSHQEARKYLDLVKARKESEEKIRMTKLDPGKKTSSGTRADTNIVEKRSKLPAPPVSKVKTETMQFELEHTLPSGTFSVFLGDKLIYQAVLAGTEKKILMFRSYKGRLTGSLELPVGQSTLGLRVVNKEFGISVFKKLSTRLEEGDSRVLKIRFLKATRELDAKWT